LLGNQIKLNRINYFFIFNILKNFKEITSVKNNKYLEDKTFIDNVLRIFKYKNNYIFISELKNINRQIVPRYMNKIRNKSIFKGYLYKEDWILLNRKFLSYQILFYKKQKLVLKFLIAPLLNDFLEIDLILKTEFYKKNINIIESFIGSFNILKGKN